MPRSDLLAWMQSPRLEWSVSRIERQPGQTVYLADASAVFAGEETDHDRHPFAALPADPCAAFGVPPALLGPSPLAGLTIAPEATGEVRLWGATGFEPTTRAAIDRLLLPDLGQRIAASIVEADAEDILHTEYLCWRAREGYDPTPHQERALVRLETDAWVSCGWLVEDWAAEEWAR